MNTFLGPAIGSVLYNSGGFLLPFVVVGSVCFALAIVFGFLIPPIEVDKERSGKKKTLSLKKMSKVTLGFRNIQLESKTSF